MSPRQPKRRLALAAAMSTLGGWLVLWLCWMFWIAPVVESATVGGSGHEWLERIIAERRAEYPAWASTEHVLGVARIVLTRLAVVWTTLILLVLLWIRRREASQRFGRFMFAPDAALNLAALRIGTFGIMLLTPATRSEFLVHAGLPDSLLFPPSGLGPLLAAFIPGPETAKLLLTAWVGVTAMAAIGFLARPAVLASAILSLIVMGIPQLHGKVNHGHHLVWFAWLLATSPCGDVLSVDAWLKGRKNAPPRDVRYGLPLRFSWLLLGLVYFFPGLWKLWTGGVDWMFSDHLRHQIWHQWTTHANWTPTIDPTGNDWLLDLGGLGVVVFELSFIALMFSRSTRLLAVALGLAFHFGTQATLNIGFLSLQACYVALVDWPWLLGHLGIRSRRLGIGKSNGPAPRSSFGPTIAVGVVLLAGNVWYGVRGDNYGWPFACYPKFAYPIREPVRAVIEVDIQTPEGLVQAESFATSRGPLRTSRWIGVVGRVLKLPEGEQRDQALAALATLANPDLPPGTVLRFHRSTYSTRPEDRERPAIQRIPMATHRIDD